MAKQAKKKKTAISHKEEISQQPAAGKRSGAAIDLATGKSVTDKAHEEAEKDIENDPEFSDPDPTDDLDEGELARADNSDEKAVDNY